MSSQTEIKEYGWTAVPHSIDILLQQRTDSNSQSSPLTIEEIGLPDTLLAREVLAYARAELPQQTFEHSMRVYYFGASRPPPPFPQC